MKSNTLEEDLPTLSDLVGINIDNTKNIVKYLLDTLDID